MVRPLDADVVSRVDNPLTSTHRNVVSAFTDFFWMTAFTEAELRVQPLDIPGSESAEAPTAPGTAEPLEDSTAELMRLFDEAEKAGTKANASCARAFNAILQDSVSGGPVCPLAPTPAAASKPAYVEPEKEDRLSSAFSKKIEIGRAHV